MGVRRGAGDGVRSGWRLFGALAMGRTLAAGASGAAGLPRLCLRHRSAALISAPPSQASAILSTFLGGRETNVTSNFSEISTSPLFFQTQAAGIFCHLQQGLREVGSRRKSWEWGL